MSGADDTLAERLAAIREREQAATPGPWWSDQDERVYRLHGVHATIPAQMFPGTDEVMIPEQVMNHQILKAPKQGTSYAEYWPGEADDAFITHARTDVPRLLAAVEAALAPHEPGRRIVTGSLCKRHETHRFFSITATEAADVDECPDCTATVYASCRACGDHVRLDACPVRADVTSALTGETDAAPPAPETPPGSSETESAYVLRRLAETAAGLPASVLPLTGAERDHLAAEFRREYREACAPERTPPA